MATEFSFPDLLNPLAGPEEAGLHAVDPGISGQAGDLENLLNPLAGAEASVVKNPFTSVTDFLNALVQRNTLTRLAEGAIGIMLIIVGVAKMAEGTKLGSVLGKVPLT
jgi:hypothetical protein